MAAALLHLQLRALCGLPEACAAAPARQVGWPVLLLAVRAVQRHRQPGRVQGRVVRVRGRGAAGSAPRAGAALRIVHGGAGRPGRQGRHQPVRRVQGADAHVPEERRLAAVAEDGRPPRADCGGGRPSAYTSQVHRMHTPHHPCAHRPTARRCAQRAASSSTTASAARACTYTASRVAGAARRWRWRG